jgi:hypothetical protein
MERTTTSKLAARSTNIPTTRSKSVRQSATTLTPSVRVLGKLCPCCGEAGAVLCETKKRIIYECPNSHQYETKKRLNDLYSDQH